MVRLREMDEGIWLVGNDDSLTDLVHSPDDDGYYFSESKQGENVILSRTSEVYPSKGAARKAWDSNKVKWDDWY